MSELIEMRCPNCGAPFNVDGVSPSMQCPFCGTVVVVPPELRRSAQNPDIPPVIPIEATTGRPVRGRSSPVGCAVLLFLLLAVGAGLALVGRSPGLIASTGGPAATATALPFQRDLSASLPREVSYGGFGIRVTQGEIDNRQQTNNQVTYLGDGAYARLSIDLQNLTRENLYLDPQLFKLRLKDGKLYSLYPGMILDNSFTAPDPGASRSTSFVFPVPFNATWDGAVLVVTDGTGEPAELNLTGDPAEPAYPKKLPLPSNPTVSAGGVTYQLQAASLDLNSGSQRAAAGTRYLILDLTMTNPTGRYGVNISSDDFRLIANGSGAAPIKAPILVIDYQTSQQGQVVFPVPASANSVQLQFGDVRAENEPFGVITLSLPAH